MGGELLEDLERSIMLGVIGIMMSSWLSDWDTLARPKGLELTV